VALEQIPMKRVNVDTMLSTTSFPARMILRAVVHRAIVEVVLSFVEVVAYMVPAGRTNRAMTMPHPPCAVGKPKELHVRTTFAVRNMVIVETRTSTAALAAKVVHAMPTTART